MVIPHAAGLIVIQGTRILMVLKPFGKISIPGGKADEKVSYKNPNKPSFYWENPQQTALREGFEETGFLFHIPWDQRPHKWQEKNVDFPFFTYIGYPYKGILTPSNEGVPFWLELSCWKNIPSVLQYPEWTRSAIEYFKL